MEQELPCDIINNIKIVVETNKDEIIDTLKTLKINNIPLIYH